MPLPRILVRGGGYSFTGSASAFARPTTTKRRSLGIHLALRSTAHLGRWQPATSAWPGILGEVSGRCSLSPPVIPHAPGGSARISGAT
jgi:hypothetical protein